MAEAPAASSTVREAVALMAEALLMSSHAAPSPGGRGGQGASPGYAGPGDQGTSPGGEAGGPGSSARRRAGAARVTSASARDASLAYADPLEAPGPGGAAAFLVMPADPLEDPGPPGSSAPASPLGRGRGGDDAVPAASRGGVCEPREERRLPFFQQRASQPSGPGRESRGGTRSAARPVAAAWGATHRRSAVDAEAAGDLAPVGRAEDSQDAGAPAGRADGWGASRAARSEDSLEVLRVGRAEAASAMAQRASLLQALSGAEAGGPGPGPGAAGASSSLATRLSALRVAGL